MKSEHVSEKHEDVGAIPSSGTTYPSSSAEEQEISNLLVGSSNLSLGANTSND